MGIRAYENRYEHVNIELEEALSLVKAHTGTIAETEEVPLSDALGRILAESVTADMDQPPFARSPLDGYALIAADTAGATKENPARLTVAGRVVAGGVFDKKICRGQAVRIMTGAPISPGADCVIRQEDTDWGEETVAVYRELSACDNYCRAGEDFARGDLLLEAGTKIGAVELGILASAGTERVRVRRIPRVAVLTTGDELVMPGEKRGPGKIYNSSLFVLAGRLRELGIEPAAGHLQDDEEAAAIRIKELAEETDLILTAGGVSVGERDIMHGALAGLLARPVFWRIRIKPGMPVIFSMVDKTPVLSLSGNPYGSFAHFEVLARPLLAHLTGCGQYGPQRESAVMGEDFGKNTSVRRLVRGRVTSGIVSLPRGLHDSGVLGTTAGLPS